MGTRRKAAALALRVLILIVSMASLGVAIASTKLAHDYKPSNSDYGGYTGPSIIYVFVSSSNLNVLIGQPFLKDNFVNLVQR
ncbi:hypothetical protein BT63DRAFT_430026 [Microthyrium microscopicum]|uniref:CASP-like protein n=1 Tax=Microthyrium microscopicum TaxID=703497 RepID=A0A6A6TWP0_9PEZI|nr:hypothetical protein BT63DRAFT_430026 [Microthyrium microscopicum]